MQTINIYFYANSIDVQVNNDPTLTLRNRVMYQRTIKIYRGVDNIVRFTFKNSDQKPVNVTGWVITFNMLSDDSPNESTVVIRKEAVVVDAVKGVVTVTLGEFDLFGLPNEYYNYSLSVTDPVTGIQQVVYTDDNYTARGEIQLLDGHYATFKPSIDVSLPTNSNSNIITSTITSDTPSRQQSAHHTAQFYFSDFTGNVAVQATLDALPPNGNTSSNVSVSWATISNLAFTHQANTSYTNWDGIYSACRFIVTPANTSPLSGTITQILYRA